MAQKAIRTIRLTETLALSERNDRWWLYDSVVGMNLGKCCKSPEAAFVEALTYYQGRLTRAEENLKSLSEKVERFVDQSVTEDDHSQVLIKFLK